MAKENVFKRFDGIKVPDYEQYVKTYIDNNPGMEILVGTDSQNRGSTTTYSTVIAMYFKDQTGQGHGAHCIFRKWRIPRAKNSEKVSFERLTNEVVASIQVADELKSAGIKNVCIDIDINPNENFESNKIFSSMKGMVIGAGFECRYKTLGPLVTTMADYIVKH